jgi:hypothetical protein
MWKVWVEGSRPKASLGRNPMQTVTKIKRAGDVAQVLGCLPRKNKSKNKSRTKNVR